MNSLLLRVMMISGLIFYLSVFLEITLPDAFAAKEEKTAAGNEDKSSAKGEKENPDLNPQKAEEEKEEAEYGPPVSVQKERKPKKILEKDLPDSEPGEAKTNANLETLEGRVSGAGYNGLAVELPNPRKDEPSEIWFDYVKGIKISSVQGLEEIQEGDTVRVSYIKGEDGRKFLKEIRRTRKKPADEILVSTETSEATGE